MCIFSWYWGAIQEKFGQVSIIDFMHLPECCVFLGSSTAFLLRDKQIIKDRPVGQVVYAREGLWEDICTNGHWTVVNSNHEPQCSLFLQDRERGTIWNIQFVSLDAHILRLATAAESCSKLSDFSLDARNRTFVSKEMHRTLDDSWNASL